MLPRERKASVDCATAGDDDLLEVKQLLCNMPLSSVSSQMILERLIGI